MSFTVRSVITEALARANLVNRRQEAPGQMVETSFRLLKGIAADYSRHNLLQFLRRELVLPEAIDPNPHYILSPNYFMGVNFWIVPTGTVPSVTPSAGYMESALAWDGKCEVSHIETVSAGVGEWETVTYNDPTEAVNHLNGAIVKIVQGGWKDKLILGTVDPDIKDDYVDVVVENLADIKEAYYENNQLQRDVQLPFVSFEDFYNGGYGDSVYTWQQISDRKVELRFTPRYTQYARSGKTKIIYNLSYKIDLDSELKVPDIYEELFITALTYKLAVEFPRLDEAHTQRLQNELKAIEDSIKTPTRANKMVLRDAGTTNNGLWNLAQLQSGAFIYPS